MKLPQFQHVDPSTRSAMVEPVLRRYAPEIRPMQFSTRQTVDPAQEYKLGMAKADAISSVGSSLAKWQETLLKTQASTEAAAAEAQYRKEMASYVAETRYSPLVEEDGSMPWMEAPENYERRSQQVRARLTRNMTGLGARAFGAAATEIDARYVDDVQKIRRDRQIDISRANLLKAVDESRDPATVDSLIEDGIEIGIIDAEDGWKLSVKRNEEIAYEGAVIQVGALRSTMDGMNPQQFDRAVDRTRELLMDPSIPMTPGSRNTALNALAQAEGDYDTRVKKGRALDRFASMMRDFYDPAGRAQFNRDMLDPQVRVELGEYYDDLVRLQATDAQTGVTSRDTARLMTSMLGQMSLGNIDPANPAHAAQFFEALANRSAAGELSTTDYDKYMNRFTALVESRRDERANLARDQIKLRVTAGFEPEYLTGSKGERIRERVYMATTELDEWLIENPDGNPLDKAREIVMRLTPVPAFSVDAEGKATRDPLAVDVAKTRGLAHKHYRQIKKDAEGNEGDAFDPVTGAQIVPDAWIRDQLENLTSLEALQGTMQ